MSSARCGVNRPGALRAERLADGSADRQCTLRPRTLENPSENT